MNDDDLLGEQRAFYRTRAPEYDQWVAAPGRYDRGEGETREWHRQVTRVDAALAGRSRRSDTLTVWAANLALPDGSSPRDHFVG
ncbi:MAG TPA: hypothetical protein VK923_09140 [Euzebyales bacterium]|nr:hypothetical protein [Euzebyales bacterium]